MVNCLSVLARRKGERLFLKGDYPMYDEEGYGDNFVIPQKRAGKHFREITEKRNIDRIGLETAGGDELVDLPVQINVKKAVPRVFLLPMQAAVTAISTAARVFRLKLNFLMVKDDKCICFEGGG